MSEIHKYAPSHISMVVNGKFVNNVPVKGYVAHPPHKHSFSYIKEEMWCLEMVTDYGSRYRGFANAYIDSTLRMVCVLAPGQERDVVLMRTWEDVV